MKSPAEKALHKAKMGKKNPKSHSFSPIGTGSIAGKFCMTCGEHKDDHK